MQTLASGRNVFHGNLVATKVYGIVTLNSVCSSVMQCIVVISGMLRVTVNHQADERSQRHYDFPTKRILLTRDPKDVSRRGQYALLPFAFV